MSRARLRIPMDSERRIEGLREELDTLDRQLLEIVRRRNDVVHRIARHKARAGGTPLFDREREREVYERAEIVAREIGLAPDIARQVIEVVVEASHRVQEWISRDAARLSASESPRKFLIVGGAGRMGRRLSADLAARGHSIDILEPDDTRDPASVIGLADIVLIAVPMERSVTVAGEVAPFVRDDALLCDINSLKSDICRVMGERCKGEVVGLHPMFGPTVRSLRRQKIVICPVREGKLAGWLRSEFAAIGLELIEADAETHDRMMAIVQVLVHFSTMVMGDALRRTGVDIDESLRFTSPVYRLELAFVGRLFAQNPDLYAEIEMSNPHANEIRAKFIESAMEIEKISRSGDRRAFRKRFEEVASWFHGFQDEAMRLSDRVIDAMIRRP